MTLSQAAERPDVSVLMSCYNASRWLRAAIDSVLCQTFANFELVLVDDGSTDGTPDVIQSYLGKDDRIIAISKSNTGLTDSLNVGIAQSKGRWIARLDADDLCEPDRLQRQVHFLRNHPDVILLGSGFIEVDEQDQALKKHQYPREHGRLLRHLERLQRFFPHSSAMFRRDYAQAAGSYNKLFRKSQDWDLWLRLAERGTIACLSEALVRVRKHSEQISNSTSGLPQLTYATIASMCHFLRIHGHEDPSIGRDERAWQDLCAWIDSKLEENGLTDRRRIWTEARDKYFATPGRLTGAGRFAVHLFNARQIFSLIRERYAGSALPDRLAKSWIGTHQTVPE